MLVLSGGQDSTTVALYAKFIAKAPLKRAVFFNYGQRHLEAEKAAAQEVAKLLDLELEEIPLQVIQHLGYSGLSVDKDADISQQHPRWPELPISFVPGRNLLFFGSAAARMTRYPEESTLWTGINATDYSGYPDCRPEFVQPLVQAIRAGMNYPEFRIAAPLLYLTKAETWRLAELALGHDGILLVKKATHTCYNGDHETWHEWGYGCGKCPACEVRERGWKEYLRMRDKFDDEDILQRAQKGVMVGA